MLLNPKTPVVIGVILIIVLGRLLMVHSPMPASLAAPHSRIPALSKLENCQTCHTEQGLTAGCLGCHDEIKSQLDSDSGYHAFLGKNSVGENGQVECAKCHSEHFGKEFQLVNQKSWGAQTSTAFKHPHVDFELTGEHDLLACATCHESERVPRISLKKFPEFSRAHTFLGVDQKCETCHEDIHAGGLTGSCAACHGQITFRPTESFDHSEYFPLDGGHDRLDCDGCHRIPPPEASQRELPFPFEQVQGTACEECHETPHYSLQMSECTTCHTGSSAQWDSALTAVTPETHDLTGFHLSGPHSRVSCEKCHASDLVFDEKYPNQTQSDYLRGQETCQGCHEDVHQGQFAGRFEGCLDCHQKQSFHPTTFTHEAHTAAYPLNGAHAAVACIGCHKNDPTAQVRTFRGTTQECKVCHADPHGGQFHQELASGDCVSCHNDTTDTFSLRPFDHEARTGYALDGAHELASCNDCHMELPMRSGSTNAMIRHYRGVSQECSTCHKDVHRGQFREGGHTNCGGCHVSFSRWTDLEFDHNTRARFPLQGAHAKLSCSGCHRQVPLEDGTRVVQYKPLGRECRDCHDIVPDRLPEDVR